MSLKNDAKAEIDRLQYLLDNYSFDENERKFAEELLNNAKTVYRAECLLEKNTRSYTNEI